MVGKIFAITSVVQGNGAKYVTTNLAFEFQKKYKDSKVLLVDFDFENPYLAYEYTKNDKVHGIDNIINSISGEGLSLEIFKENIVNTSINLDVLKGTKFLDRHKNFTKEVIETILELAKSIYDYIFVVINNNAKNAGTVYSLMNADELILITKNNYSNMEKINKVIKTLSIYYKKQKEILMIYNMKNHNAKAEVNSNLTDSNVKIIGVLDYDEKTIDNVNLAQRMGKLFTPKCVNNKIYLKIIDILKN